VVRLALEAPHPQILYSDFDHALRWIALGSDELRNTLAASPEAALLVVGRSARAFAAEPLRLQETERVVNRIYALMTGHDWDLMAALRRLSREAAELIVTRATVDTIANDVEWPLLAERAGLRLAYAETDSFTYRMMEEFDASADTGDGEPANWIKRLEYAALHAAAMRAYLR
jgi:hypothetical protein